MILRHENKKPTNAATSAGSELKINTIKQFKSINL